MVARKQGKQRNVAPRKRVNRRNRRSAVNSAFKTTSTTSVSAPIASSKRVTVGKATISNNSNGSIRVRHREYLADVVGTAAFTTLKFAVNPGIGATFPWLSALAERFERYKFNQLKFDYLPSCAVTTAGTIMSAYDTDVTDGAPTTKLQLLSYQNATRSPPWSSWCAIMPRVTDFQDRFVRTGAAPSGTDLKMYDIANLWLATDKAGTEFVGELYVDYDITLLIPQMQISPSPSPPGPTSYFSAVFEQDVTVPNFDFGTFTDREGGLTPIFDADTVSLDLEAGQNVLVTFSYWSISNFANVTAPTYIGAHAVWDHVMNPNTKFSSFTSMLVAELPVVQIQFHIERTADEAGGNISFCLV